MALYAWGANSYGQLGMGNCDDVWSPTKVDSMPFSRITAMAAGGGHSIVIGEDGRIAVCGNNSKGQIGVQPSVKNVSSFTEINHSEISSSACSVACGWEHSLITTVDGQVYGLGCNGYEQLGIDGSLTATSKLRRIPNLDNIVMAACGLRHSMALSRDGNVFCWGDSRKGQLGRKTGQDSSVLPVDGIPEPVVSIAAGQHHSVALGASGTVYTWGCNKHGQLGVDPRKVPSSGTPIPVPSLPKNILSINSGWSHVIACTEDGQLLCWGRSNYGQLGSSQPSSGPKVIEGFRCRIQANRAHLACGAEHNHAVANEDGLLWSWGWNEHGMCGLGRVKQDVIHHPQLIEVPVSSGAVELITCGSGHSLAFTV